VRLPEHAKVYVVIPGAEAVTRFHAVSPRLADPRRAADFLMEVSEEPEDAGQRR
jgi:hypothetical protein